MPKVTYVEHDGTAHDVDLETGRSVMQGAVDNNIPGIDADCGGQCACATCHVYVDAAWLDRIEEISEQEKGMLSLTGNARDNSRLSCQIHMAEELDGLLVRLPQSQH